MKTVLAVAFAIIASICINYALFLQKKAVDTLPSVELRLSRDVLRAFFTNKPWVASLVITLIGAGLYSVAISLAPISIVQPILGSGVVLLAYLAMKNLGEKPRRIDLYAIGMCILGVILIGVSLAEGIPENVQHDAVELWIFAGAVVFVSIVIPLIMRGATGNKQAAALGVSVGLLMGIAAIFARLLLVDWGNQWSSSGIKVLVSSVFLPALLLTIIPGFIMLQAALQRGMAVVVVPIVAGLSQLVPIIGGMIALNEPLPENKFLSALRITAFVLILIGTVILSRRAEETGADFALERELQPEAE